MTLVVFLQTKRYRGGNSMKTIEIRLFLDTIWGWFCVAFIEILILSMGIFYGYISILATFRSLTHSIIINGFNEEIIFWIGVLISGALSIILLRGFWSLLQYLARDKIILSLIFGRSMGDDAVSQRLVLEVLRANISSYFPEYKTCEPTEKYASAPVILNMEEWKDSRFSQKLECPVFSINMWELNDIAYNYISTERWNSYKGRIVGKRKTLLDSLLFLGHRYLIVFPSGLCVSTHADGFIVSN